MDMDRLVSEMRGEAFHIAANQVTDEQLAAWLGFSAIGHDNKLYAEEHGEESYMAQYKRAGGSRKYKDANGVRYRQNQLTGDAATNGCYTCGTILKVKPCAGCKSIYYCSTACQRKDWRRHKHACREQQKVIAEEGHPKFDACKWLLMMPDSAKILKEATKDTEALIPCVTFVIGHDIERPVTIIHSLRTVEDVDELKGSLPEMLRGVLCNKCDSAPERLDAAASRSVVAIVRYLDGVQAMRLRVDEVPFPKTA